ncbi:MAG: hypothetical protein AAF193_09865, partial [Bacteroidota bacterium]
NGAIVYDSNDPSAPCFSCEALRAQSSFAPGTKAELEFAVELWVTNEADARATYGTVNTWDVSGVTGTTQRPLLALMILDIFLINLLKPLRSFKTKA